MSDLMRCSSSQPSAWSMCASNSEPRADSGGGRLVFGDPLQHAAGPGHDIGVHRRGRIEIEHLREIAGHQVAAADDLAGIRRHGPGDDLEKSRFARAVPPEQAEALALVDHEAGLVEHLVGAIRDGEGAGTENGGGHAGTKSHSADLGTSYYSPALFCGGNLA